MRLRRGPVCRGRGGVGDGPATSRAIREDSRDELRHHSEVPRVRPGIPDQAAARMRGLASARSRSLTTTRRFARRCRARLIAARPHNLWRYRELLPVDGEPEAGPFSGFTPLLHAQPARRGARAQEALYQGRHRQPSHALLQGPRGVGRDHQGARLRLHHRLMRLDRQPGDSGGGACGARGTSVGNFHARRRRVGQNRRLVDLRRAR